MTSVFVTGGSGFLGKRVLAELVQRDFEVHALTRSDAAAEICRSLGAHPVTGDLEDRESTLRAFRQESVDAVVNLASLGFGHAPVLVEASVASGADQAIFVSTMSVMTALPSGSKPTRVAAEEAIRESPLRWTIIRPTMIYGAPDDRNMVRLVRILKRAPLLLVPGSGKALQQPVHVEDLARGIVACIGREVAVGKTYSLAGPAAVPLDEVIRQAGAAIGRSPSLIHVPLAPVAWLISRYEQVTSNPRLRPEQIYRLAEDKNCSIALAVQDLGFSPRSFHIGIQEEVALLEQRSSSSSMRVVIVNQYAQPPSEPGNTRTHAFATRLVGSGHQVTVVAVPQSYMTRRQRVRTPATQTIEGVNYRWVQSTSHSANDLKRVLGMISFGLRVCSLRRLGSPDVVVGSSPSPFAAAAAAVLATRTRAAFVMEVRDLWPDSLVDLSHISRSHPFVRVLSVLERWLYRRSVRTVTVLPDAIDVIEERSGRRGFVEWIPNGVELRAIGPAETRAHVGSPTVVMYAGAHGEPNGLDSVLDAAAELGAESDAWSFRLIGDGVEKARLRRRVVDEGIRNVSLEDPVPKTEIYDVLRQADIFVLPLKDAAVFHHGVSPNKLFDYMAMARPIVYAVNSSNDPVVEAGAGIRVPPGDARALAQALRLMSSMSQAERDLMGKSGRQYVERIHDLDELGDRLESVLEAARSEGARPSKRGRAREHG